MKTGHCITGWFFVSVLLSCGQKEKDFKLEYFPSGEIKSIKHYKAKVLDGESVWFYKSGIVKEINFFKNGKGEGYFFYYYQSGCMSGYNFYRDNIPRYGLDYHDEPQLIIKSILQYNNEGQIFYKKNFDDHGNFLNVEGSRPE